MHPEQFIRQMKESNNVTATHTSPFGEVVRHTYDLNKPHLVYYAKERVGFHTRGGLPEAVRIVYTYTDYEMTIARQTMAGHSLYNDQVTVKKHGNVMHTEDLATAIPVDARVIIHVMRELFLSIMEKHNQYVNLTSDKMVKVISCVPQEANASISVPHVQQLPDIAHVLNTVLREEDCSYITHFVHAPEQSYRREYVVIGLFQRRSPVLDDVTYEDFFFNLLSDIDDENDQRVADEGGSTDTFFTLAAKDLARRGVVWMIQNNQKYKNLRITRDVSLVQIGRNLTEILESIKMYPMVGYALNPDVTRDQSLLNYTVKKQLQLIGSLETRIAYLIQTTEIR